MFAQQMLFDGAHDYNDPDVLSPALRAWFDDMIVRFPPMNGPLASAADDAKTTDYSLAPAFIYAAFAWSVAEEAHAAADELARKHGLGFYDPQTDLVRIP